MMKMYKNIELVDCENLLKRSSNIVEDIIEKVNTIFNDVKLFKDKALLKYSENFDQVISTHLKINVDELKVAYDSIDGKLKEAIIKAKSNIEKFHQSQLINEIIVETTAGVVCRRKGVPIDRIGLYIPGGTAPLFSTILMLAIPAKLAGCKRIIICTPPKKDGINQAILATAYLCGIDEVYAVGGAQAIAAMTFGAESVPKVDKICGPGNQYVTSAKQIAQSYGVSIDLPAGPSELLIYADVSCIPEYVAADLLSQAEHGEDSQVILIVPDQDLCDKIYTELELQLSLLPRKDVACIALQHSVIIIENNIQKSFDIINEYAPEHLIIASDEPEKYIDLIRNAGSVFLGNYTPEAAGDYASGTNHTLPTNGWAKSYSGVSIDTFLKFITFQSISHIGISNLGDTIITMAEAEQLLGHANAVKIRLKNK